MLIWRVIFGRFGWWRFRIALMDVEHLHQIIRNGETETVEFKKSFSDLVIETLVAFSNAKGGQIFIGINDKRQIFGIEIGKETIA